MSLGWKLILAVSSIPFCWAFLRPRLVELINCCCRRGQHVISRNYTHYLSGNSFPYKTIKRHKTLFIQLLILPFPSERNIIPLETNPRVLFSRKWINNICAYSVIHKNLLLVENIFSGYIMTHSTILSTHTRTYGYKKKYFFGDKFIINLSLK